MPAFSPPLNAGCSLLIAMCLILHTVEVLCSCLLAEDSHAGLKPAVFHCSLLKLHLESSVAFSADCSCCGMHWK